MRQFRGLLLTGNACAITVIVIGVALFIRSGDPPKAAAQPPRTAVEKQEAETAAAADASFLGEKFLPFLKQYCFDCHEGEEPESELRLDQHKSLDELKGDRKRWTKVIRMLSLIHI